MQGDGENGLTPVEADSETKQPRRGRQRSYVTLSALSARGEAPAAGGRFGE